MLGRYVFNSQWPGLRFPIVATLVLLGRASSHSAPALQYCHAGILLYSSLNGEKFKAPEPACIPCAESNRNDAATHRRCNSRSKAVSEVLTLNQSSKINFRTIWTRVEVERVEG